MNSSLLLDFVGDLYEASFQENGNWDNVVTRLCQLVNAHSGVILVEDRVNGTRDILGSCGIPKAAILAYRFGLSKYDYTFQLQQQIPVGTAQQLVNAEDIKSSHPIYYRLILKANDIGYLGTMNIFQDSEWHVGIGLHRSFKSEAFSEADLATLQSLYPHFRRALHIRRAFYKLRDERSSLQAALTRLTLGLIVLNPNGQIDFVNPVAKSLLENHSGLFINSHNCLQAYHPKEQHQLQDLIHSLLQSNKPDVDLAMGVHHPQQTHPINVLLTKTDPKDNSIGLPKVAVYLSSADSAFSVCSERLTSFYSLTPAESSVAIALANGLTLAQISSAHTVSIETVRTQLKSIFQKMGVSKQQDVIRVLLSGVLRVN